jgi:hypothetical protein
MDTSRFLAARCTTLPGGGSGSSNLFCRHGDMAN